MPLKEYFLPVHESLAFSDFAVRLTDPRIRRTSWKVTWRSNLTPKQEMQKVKGKIPDLAYLVAYTYLKCEVTQ